MLRRQLSIGLGLVIGLGCMDALQAQLEVEVNERGLDSLRYNGLDLLQNGEFRVNGVTLRTWGGETMAADLQGSEVTWDPESRTLTRTWGWGTVAATYAHADDRLGIRIKVTNGTDELTIAGIFLQLMELRFPACPKGFDGNPRLQHNVGGPTVLGADYGEGVLVLCNEDVGRPLMVGYPWSIGDREANTTYPLWIYTSRHGMLPNSLPTIDRPIYPGGSDEFQISLRFGSGGSDPLDLAEDVLQRYAEAYPMKLPWDDRRPIGSLFLSSSATGYATNPRGWFNSPEVDVTTENGLAAFRERLLGWADGAVKILQDMDAQGVILWDPEGQEFPHAISYLGDPRSLPPEIDPLIDEFFERFSAAGLRTGVCVRPQRPARRAYDEGVFQLEVADPVANLIDKIGHAKERWGCTLFYVDSNGDPNLPMPASIFRAVAEAHPDVLLIPEHENTLYHAYTAPYDELRGGVTSTPSLVRRIYPTAFSIINVADGPLDGRRAELVEAVKAGDILMFRGWFNDTYNAGVKGIYETAGER